MSGDEAVPSDVTRAGRDGPGGCRMVELDRDESLALLASVPFGRVVFTQDALPAIRPVNHLVDDGRIIIRTRLTAKISHAVHAPQATVVAYQADQIDPQQRTGWSVVVTGFARPAANEAESARLDAALQPWVDMTMDTILVIVPQLITGYRLTKSD